MKSTPGYGAGPSAKINDYYGFFLQNSNEQNWRFKLLVRKTECEKKKKNSKYFHFAYFLLSTKLLIYNEFHDS